MFQLRKIHVEGFKSFRDVTLELGAYNVLIGANGAGKSNLVSFFQMLRAMAHGQFQEFVGLEGGSQWLLHHGPKETAQQFVELTVADDETAFRYRCRVSDAPIDSLRISDEIVDVKDSDSKDCGSVIGAPTLSLAESTVLQFPMLGPTIYPIANFLKSSACYHFHDTSRSAGIRRKIYHDDNRILSADGANLAAVLLRLKTYETNYYNRILGAIRQIAPFFDDFDIATDNARNVALHWRQKGSGALFGPHQISDGLLRYMALVTLLLGPEKELPTLLVVDEPELGLHPAALSIVSGLLQAAAVNCQVVVSTQSTLLLRDTEPLDVIVADRDARESTLRRLRKEDLDLWLDDFSLDELWERNIIGGGPY